MAIKIAGRQKLAMAASQAPQAMHGNRFSKQFKESSFHLCLVKGAKTLGPSENSASSLTLGITKVLFFKATFSPPGVAQQI